MGTFAKASYYVTNASCHRIIDLMEQDFFLKSPSSKLKQTNFNNLKIFKESCNVLVWVLICYTAVVCVVKKNGCVANYYRRPSSILFTTTCNLILAILASCIYCSPSSRNVGRGKIMRCQKWPNPCV